MALRAEGEAAAGVGVEWRHLHSRLPLRHALHRHHQTGAPHVSSSTIYTMHYTLYTAQFSAPQTLYPHTL